MRGAIPHAPTRIHGVKTHKFTFKVKESTIHDHIVLIIFR
jgi:hypothetical protein